MRLPLLAGVAVLLLAGLIAIWGLTRPRLSDEAMIVKLIADVKRAVEAKDVSGVLKYVSDDYNDGTYTKRDITRLVISGFQEAEPFNVYVETPQVQVTGDRARARVRAQFWLGAPGKETERTSLDVQVELVRGRRGWQVIRATGWEPAMDAEA